MPQLNRLFCFTPEAGEWLNADCRVLTASYCNLNLSFNSRWNRGR